MSPQENQLVSLRNFCREGNRLSLTLMTPKGQCPFGDRAAGRRVVKC